MAWWQYALLALVIAWALQAYGVWRQTQHYQGVFKELRRGWSDGMLGVGAAPAKSTPKIYRVRSRFWV